MSTRRLVAYVYVRDEHGWPVRFGPHDDVPDWAAEQIRNPHAWASEQPGAAPGSPPAGAAATPPPADTTAPTSAGQAPATPTTSTEPPPRAGKGSGTAAWAAYARGNGVQVGPQDSREDIIAALEAAGIRTD